MYLDLPDLLIELFTDYAVVIIMGVFIYAGFHWIVSAHRWFKGPVKTVDDPQSSRASQVATEEKQ